MHNKTSALTLFLVLFLIDSFYLNHISAQNYNPVVQIRNVEILILQFFLNSELLLL